MALLDDTCSEKRLLFGRYDYRRTLRTAAKTAGLPADKRKHLSAHDIRHAAVTHVQEVSQNIAGAAYMAGHRRTATTNAYTEPNYAAGVAIQHARCDFRHTDSENANGGETETAPSACDHLVGTGRIELPTPTVSRIRAARGRSLSLIESGGPAGPNGANLGTAEHHFRHGVSIVELAEYLLDHPGDAEAVIALAGWVLEVAEGGRLVKRAEAKKPKSRIVTLRMDEDDFSRLDALARQTSFSRGEVLRRCLASARLKSTVDAQALTEVARVHADLNRIGGLLKLAIREGVSDPSSHNRLNLELLDSIIQVRRAVERLAGRP